MSDKLNKRSRIYCQIAEGCIKQLLNEFVTFPSYFFSESDVKCRLFMILFKQEEIGVPKRTIDNKMTWPLHTEVSYFDDEGRLLFHVDMSAVDPGFTDMQSYARKGMVRLAKGYRANVCYFAIELKLNKLYKKPKILKNWTADMEKLSSIRTRNPYLTCFSILFDKKANTVTKDEFEKICNEYKQVRILYANTAGEIFANF